MQKITPFLWFDDKAEEAMDFYVSAFGGDAKVVSVRRYPAGGEGPMAGMDGKVLTGVFEIRGQRFMALDGGPTFKLNPSVSFLLNFDPSKDDQAREHLDALWEKLADGGTALMEIGEYPFSKRYGWIQDRYGVSWQLMLTDPSGEERPFITPSLLFVGDNAGRAEEAVDFYVSVFRDSRRGQTARYPAGSEPDKEGTLMFADFQLENVWFAAMDSAHEHKFAFTEATSFLIDCADQEEVDYFWEKLREGGGQESQCGWLKDRFGVSWQAIPRRLMELTQDPDPEKAKRATDAMLTMRKIVVADIEKAAAGE